MHLEIRHRKMSTLGALGLTLGIALIIYAMVLIHPLLTKNIPYAEFILYGAVALLAVGVAYRIVFEYAYTLKDDALLIERKTGERLKHMRRIPLAEVAYYGDVALAPAGGKTVRYTLHDQPLPVKALLYSDEGKLFTVHIHVDDKLDALLSQTLVRKEQA